MIIPDNAQKRAQYEEQVIVSFPLSYVDSQELAQTINQVIRPVGQALAPAVTANKSTNTLTIRATTAMMAIIERMIETLDKPRAEIIVDVQILEVSRTRASSSASISGTYSIIASSRPSRSCRVADREEEVGRSGDRAPRRALSTLTPSRAESTPGFLSGCSLGGHPVPRDRLRDQGHRQAAASRRRGFRPQTESWRGHPGPSDHVHAARAGWGQLQSADVVHLSPRWRDGADDAARQHRGRHSDQVDDREQQPRRRDHYRRPGASRHSVRGKWRLTCDCARGSQHFSPDCFRSSQRKMLSGLPWVMHLPVIKQLFSANDNSVQQSDVVMLLTPRIVRSREFSGHRPRSDLHRHAIEPRSEWPAAIDWPTCRQPRPNPRKAEPLRRSCPRHSRLRPHRRARRHRREHLPRPPGQVQPTAATHPAAANVFLRERLRLRQVRRSLGPRPTRRVRLSCRCPAQSSGWEEVRISFRYRLPGPVQLSGVTLTVTYNPAVIRLVNVQEGSFMRAGRSRRLIQSATRPCRRSCRHCDCSPR